MGLNEQDVVITTKHGRMPAFAACPAEGGPVPAVIFYMDAPGYREELKNMARRIAKQGYFCVLPDMYYRLGTIRFDLPRRNDEMSAVIRASMNHLSNQLVSEDTGCMLAWLDAGHSLDDMLFSLGLIASHGPGARDIDMAAAHEGAGWQAGLYMHGPIRRTREVAALSEKMDAKMDALRESVRRDVTEALAGFLKRSALLQATSDTLTTHV